MNAFTTKGILGEAWILLKKEWQVIYGSFGVLVLLNIISTPFTKEEGVEGAIFSLLFGLIAVVLQLGIIRIFLDITEGKPAHLSQLLSEYRLTLTYIVATLAYALITGLGLLLLIVPGVIFALMFSQYRYLIVDKKLGFYQSLSESEKLTRGVKMKLLSFWFLMLLVVLVSVIPLGLGLVVTIPLTTLAGVILYQRLLAYRDGVSSPSTTQEVPTPPLPSGDTQEAVASVAEPSVADAPVPKSPEVK